MVSRSFVQGRFRVEMPVVLTGGSSATLAVWRNGNGQTFMVADDGASLFEVTAGAFRENLCGLVAKERCARVMRESW